MIFRVLLLCTLMLLTACNRSETSTPETQGIYAAPDTVQPGAGLDAVSARTDPAAEENSGTAGISAIDEASVMLQSIGEAVRKEASGPKEVAQTEADAGATYASVAAKENAVVDVNDYNKGVVGLDAVSEASGVKHHRMTLNGKTVYFTARAGHVIAYAQKNPANPDKKDAQAAIFYQAYTRDDLPREQRPVTFLFNGGPGSSSLWLHLGSWAPKRLRVPAPDIPEIHQKAQPDSLELVDNDATLLDQTDLVFVDALSTGYSVAIKPHNPAEFRNVDADAALIRDFITSYTNKFNRQSSPKYLYGESYSGIRAPIVARLLQDAGSSNFLPDPSGKPAISLSGVVLNSPILDYGSNVDANGRNSTNAGALPTYAMIADYHKGLRAAGTSSTDYANLVRQFVNNDFKALLKKYDTGRVRQADIKWVVQAPSDHDNAVIDRLAGYTGIVAAQWKADLNMWPAPFRNRLMPVYSLGYYDGRLKIRNSAYNPDDYERKAFANEIKKILPDFLNYSNKSTYVLKGKSWNTEQDKHSSSLPDIAQALSNDSKLKMLILHGYYDLATPFFQTELDLSGAGLNIPVHMFEAGHMIYYSEATHAPLKKLFNDYYNPPTISAMN